MNMFTKRGPLRRSISSLVTMAMTVAMIVMPVGPVTAASSSSGDLSTVVSGGTNLTTLGTVTQSSNGLNGEFSVTIAGSVATRTRLEAGYSSLDDTLTLGGVGVTDFGNFQIEYGSPGDPVAPTTITGLSAGSTIRDLRDRIEAQVPSITTSIEGGSSHLFLTANDWGKAGVAVSDVAGGVGPVIFGVGAPAQLDTYGNPLGASTYGYTFSGGSDYTSDWSGGGVPVTADLAYTASPFASYAVGAVTLGSTDPYGVFSATPDAAGAFTAVKLPAGYDVVLCTEGGIGIGTGTAKVTVSGGVRTTTEPTLTVTASTNPVEAGGLTTITAEFTPATTDNEAGIDGATFTLPEGFVPTQTGAAAMVGVTPASMTVDVASRSVVIKDFFAKGADKLTLTLPSRVPTAVGEYGFEGTYKNVGGSATPAADASGTISVVAVDGVATVRFQDTAMTYRAGGIAEVGARLYDAYGNELSGATWPRTVKASATSTMAAAQVLPVTADGLLGHKTVVGLPLVPGTTTVKYSVYRVGSTTVEQSGTVQIDTAGIGAPAGLSLVSSQNPASAETTVAFRVQLRDAAGNTTAYLPGELPDRQTAARIAVAYGPKAGVYATTTCTIPDRRSEAVVSLKSAAGDTTWEMNAQDRDGALKSSTDLIQVWASDVQDEYDALSVSADPAMFGDDRYGYAAANGANVVTFSVRTDVPKAGVRILARPASTVSAGILTNTSAVTNASGVATFTVRSSTPSILGDEYKQGRAFKQFVFSDASDGAISTIGCAHFYSSEVASASASKLVAFADGTDKITYTFTVKDPLTKVPAPAGVRIYFSAGGYDSADTVLSATSGVTDANGLVSVDVTRDESTTIPPAGTVPVAWVNAFESTALMASSAPSTLPTGTPGVQFLDYVATSSNAVSAQQSARGSAALADIVVKDAAGTTVAVSKVSGLGEAPGVDVLKSAPLTGEIKSSAIRVGVEVKADDPAVGREWKAGDVVHTALNGWVTAVGPLSGQTLVPFGYDMPIAITTTATATARGSIYLGKAYVTGSGFKPGTAAIKAMAGDVSYALNPTTLGVDLAGNAQPQLFEIPVTMPKGTYDLVIDGMTFPAAMVVGDGIDIGVTKVVIQMGASRGPYPNYALRGNTITLFGAVTTVGNAGVPSAIVNVYSSAYADGRSPTFIGSVLTGNGQFAYLVTADKTKYYYATTAANSQYMSGDSRTMHGSALLVGVKTTAALKITSAPATARRYAYFTVRGTVPRHRYRTSATIRTYQLVGTRWVRKGNFSVSVAPNSAVISKSIRLTARGKWRVVIAHSDYDHLTSFSPYRSVLVR